MQSESTEHLLNLDHCQNREARRAYLTIVLAAERAGYATSPRAKGEERVLLIRHGLPQPFSLTVNRQSLLFYIRRPALDERPELHHEARRHFGEAVKSDIESTTETRIQLNSERDADTLADWLFPTLGVGVSPEYAERRSA